MEDKKEVQRLLEKSACKRNGGICESYEYCKFCKEPTAINRDSETPCADAYYDLKKVNKMIREYYNNIKYVEIGQERIKIWEKELNNHYYDEEYLAEWYGTLKTSDTYGMPKAMGMYISPVEKEQEQKENARAKIKKIIKIEKERIENKDIETKILTKVFEKFEGKDEFILKLLLENYKMPDILLSYERSYGKLYSEKGMKNRIALIKKKIWTNFKKIQKSTFFLDKGVL